MSEETTIQEQLQARFPFLKDKVRVARVRRLFADVPPEGLGAVFDYAVKQLGFSILCAISGTDQGANLGLIYHLARPSGVVFNLVTAVPKDRPVLQTVTPYFPQADCYERELVDLLGAQVQGLPAGHRYPLPDDWPANQYPLRKDWTSPDAQPEETDNA
jgi:Ni,Fe-hydrogenase III component G